MKTAIFSLAYVPFVGGAELAIKEITDRLRDRNFICFTHRFDFNWLVEEKVGNVEVVRLGQIAKRKSQSVNDDKRYAISDSQKYYGHFWQKFFYIFRAWRAAEKVHKITPFDAVWAVMASYGGFAALLFKLRHPKTPMLLTLQEGDSEEHILRRVGIFYPIWRLIFKKSDYIQAISYYLADFARRHGARCPIEVVPNGVAIRKFQIPKSKLPMNSESQNPSIKTIITTSRLVHKNGIDTLVQAAALLKNQFLISNFQFLIIGGGPEEQKLKQLAQDLGVADRIEFMGHIEPEKIPGYLNQADIFVRPSRSEGLGSSFLEAMAAGLPIIGTPVGGIPDFLRGYNADDTNKNANDANGMFTAVDNPADLAEKIALLLKDEKLRKQLGENGCKLIAEKYDWDNIALSFQKVFERVIK